MKPSQETMSQDIGIGTKNVKIELEELSSGSPDTKADKLESARPLPKSVSSSSLSSAGSTDIEKKMAVDAESIKRSK